MDGLHRDYLTPLIVSLTARDAMEGGRKELLARARAFDPGFEYATTRYSDDGVLQYALLEHAQYNLVLYPGTRCKSDWVNNMSCVPTRFRDGWVHSGFWSAVSESWPSLKRALGRTEGPVVFAGHSRGGACAVLSALRFGNEERLGAVITFAQPRVVCSTLAERILTKRWGERYTRYTCTSDLVPMLPIVPFRHGGTHVMLHGDDHPLFQSAVANPSHSDTFREVVRDNPIFHRPHRIIEQARVCVGSHRHRMYAKSLSKRPYLDML